MGEKGLFSIVLENREYWFLFTLNYIYVYIQNLNEVKSLGPTMCLLRAIDYLTKKLNAKCEKAPFELLVRQAKETLRKT